MQLGTSLPGKLLLRIVEIAPLVDRITDASMTAAVGQGADGRFTKARDRLSDVHFINLVVDAGTVSQMKSIPFLFTNAHLSEQHVLLGLRENRISRFMMIVTYSVSSPQL
jgi:hypothetical protein